VGFALWGFTLRSQRPPAHRRWDALLTFLLPGGRAPFPRWGPSRRRDPGLGTFGSRSFIRLQGFPPRANRSASVALVRHRRPILPLWVFVSSWSDTQARSRLPPGRPPPLGCTPVVSDRGTAAFHGLTCSGADRLSRADPPISRFVTSLRLPRLGTKTTGLMGFRRFTLGHRALSPEPCTPLCLPSPPAGAE
jgi:hypothetical protein